MYREKLEDGYSHAEATESLGIRKRCCKGEIQRPGIINRPPTQDEMKEQIDYIDDFLSEEIGYLPPPLGAVKMIRVPAVSREVLPEGQQLSSLDGNSMVSRLALRR